MLKTYEIWSEVRDGEKRWTALIFQGEDVIDSREFSTQGAAEAWAEKECEEAALKR